nr:signal peptidase I [Vagococcus allomyrinae]
MVVRVREYIKRRYGFLLRLLLLILSRIFYWEIITVFGDSMAPAYVDQQRLVGVNYSQISRFDVVMIQKGDVSDTNYLKRIIGLPGEQIDMVEDELRVDGKIINETFLLPYQIEFYQDKLKKVYAGHTDYQQRAEEARCFTSDFSLVVPEGQYFVMGDNRIISLDSRSESFGMIARSEIKKEIVLTVWPISEFKLK